LGALTARAAQIDMTRSNAFKGRKTFGGKNLHEIDKVAEWDSWG
jgi:hypothetical protein